MLDFIKLEETTDASGLLKILVPWIDEETRRYRPKHVEWEKNLLFYLGKHWIEHKSQTDGFLIYEDDDEHFYPVTNYAKLYVDFKLNQFAGKKVVAVVKPASLSPKDIFDARLGHLALRAKYKIDNEPLNDRLVCLHAEILGIGWRTDFKEPIPNKYLNRELTQKVDVSHYDCSQCGYSDNSSPQCPQCSADTTFTHQVENQSVIDEQTGMPAVEQIPMYKTCSEVVDPFRIMTSRSLTDKGRAWLIDQSMQPVRWVQANFDKEGNGYTGRGREVKKSTKLPRSLRISQDLKSAMALKNSAIYNTVTSSEMQFKNDEDSTLFFKTYFPACPNYPKGRLLIFTETVLLYDGLPDTPQKNKKYTWWNPYTSYVWAIHPMNSEGVSLIGDLIPLNKQINAIDAMVLEHLDKTAAPQEVRYSNVRTNIDDNTNGYMMIDAIPNMPNGGAPFYLQSPAMGNNVYEFRISKVKEMEKISKVPEVVQGVHPAGVDTFRGMKLLREASESAEADQYNRWYEYSENYNKLKLCLIQECMLTKDTELISLMHTLNENEGNSEDTLQDFIGANLGDQWNLEVEETDYLSNTKGAESESIKDAITSQIITAEELSDPLIKFNTLQKMGIADLVEGMATDDIHKMLWIIKLLEEQNFDKVAGVIKPYDNQPLQLRMLMSWMKKPRFFDLDPSIQEHAEALRVTLANQVAAALPSAAPVAQQPPPASPSVTTA